jgi:hypothetical protein
MAKKLVLPRVHVLVLCEEMESSVEEDGVFNLAGVRPWIAGDGFPLTQPQLCVYLQLTGHKGTTLCHLEVVRAETDDVIHATKARKVELHGPLDVVPVGFRLRNCVFPASGLYYMQAYCDGKLLGECLFILLEN